MLEDHSHLVTSELDQLTLGRGKDIPALKPHLTRSWFDQSSQTAKQCRLAGSGQSHDNENLARAHVEGDIAHRWHIAFGSNCFDRGIVTVAAQEPSGIGPIELPQVAA